MATFETCSICCVVLYGAPSVRQYTREQLIELMPYSLRFTEYSDAKIPEKASGLLCGWAQTKEGDPIPLIVETRNIALRKLIDGKGAYERILFCPACKGPRYFVDTDNFDAWNAPRLGLPPEPAAKD